MAPLKDFEIFAVKTWEDDRVNIHMASLQGTKTAPGLLEA